MELDLHSLGWSRVGGHVLYCFGSVAVLMGRVCFMGRHCLVLGPYMVAAVVVSIGLRLFCLQFAGCDVTLRLFRSKIFHMSKNL